MKKVKVLAFTFTTTILTVVTGVAPAYATTTDFNTPQFDGEQYTFSSVISKVDGEIERNNDTYINTSYPNCTSSAWVMMTNPNSSSDFAQVGFIKTGSTAVNDGIYYFFEEVEPLSNGGTKDIRLLTNGNSFSSGPYTGAVGPAVNYYHDYTVQYNSSTNSWVGTVDGAFGNVFTTSDSDGWHNYATQFQAYEEVHATAYGRFFGGQSTATQTIFYGLGAYTTSGTWQYPNFTSVITSTSSDVAGQSKAQSGASAEMFVWDTRSS